MSPDLTHERRGLLIVGLILMVLLSAPVLAAVTQVPVSGDVPLTSNSSMEIVISEDDEYNLATPFVDKDTIELKNVTFNGANSEARVETFGDPASGGTETRLVQMDVQTGSIEVVRPQNPGVEARGTIRSLTVRDINFSKTDESADINASATSDFQLTISDTGLAQGTGLVMVNADTGEPLDAVAVDSNGVARFDELEAIPDTEINIRRGASELKVFKETAPNELVSNVTLRVRIFGTEQVVERTTTNGRVDLTGLPSDRRLIVTVAEGQDFSFRRIPIPSIEQQQEVYLANSTADPIARVDFQIDDQTAGEFPPGETRFTVRKPIRKDFNNDGTNTTKFQVIAGDRIGNAKEFSTLLKIDERYRLQVSNNDGDLRELGAFTVSGPAAPVIEIGQIALDSDTEKGYAASLERIERDANNDGTDEEFVRVVYEDPDERTLQLRYEVLRVADDGTESVLLSNTVDGPLGSHTFSEQVAQNATGSSYRLDWEADREQQDGSVAVESSQQFAGDIPEIGGRLPLDPRWLQLFSLVSIVAVAGLVVIFDTAVAGLVTTGWASVVTLLGFVAIPLPALALAGGISVVAIVGRSR